MGFVEQQHLGLLGERHGDPDALPLPAGELRDGSVLQIRGAGRRQGILHGLLVVPAPLREEALMGEAAAGDELAHRDAVGGGRGLREQTEPPGELLAGEGVDVLAIEHDVASARRHQPGQAAQHGGLPAAVGPDDDRDLPFGQSQIEVVDDLPTVVGQVQPSSLDQCHQPTTFPSQASPWRPRSVGVGDPPRTGTPPRTGVR